MGDGWEQGRKAPEAWADTSGAGFPSPGGSREKEGVIVLFVTVDQIRRSGTLAVKMWIEKNIPLRPPRLRPGRVVEFDRTGHQAAPTEES